MDLQRQREGSSDSAPKATDRLQWCGVTQCPLIGGIVISMLLWTNISCCVLHQAVCGYCALWLVLVSRSNQLVSEQAAGTKNKVRGTGKIGYVRIPLPEASNVCRDCQWDANSENFVAKSFDKSQIQKSAWQPFPIPQQAAYEQQVHPHVPSHLPGNWAKTTRPSPPSQRFEWESWKTTW